MAFDHARFAMHRDNHQEAYSLHGDIYANNAEVVLLAHAQNRFFIQHKSSRALSKIIA
jgi:hypothetical protein